MLYSPVNLYRAQWPSQETFPGGANEHALG